MSWLRMIAVVLLIAGIGAAEAAPLVPPGDQPGRERYRFTPSPLDRFMQPAPPERPLLRWGCGRRSVSRSQHPGAIGIVEIGETPSRAGHAACFILRISGGTASSARL